MNIFSKGALSLLVLSLAATANTFAKPNVGAGNDRKSLLKTAAACNPASATIDLDINNVRARLMTGGDMWWDRGTGTARYEVPKGSGKSSLYAGSVWVAGYDAQGALKVAAQTYRQNGNDYWPGPTQSDANGVNSAPDQTVCSDWDKFWKVDRATLLEFIEKVKKTGTVPTETKYESIVQWPATGNKMAVGTSGAPLAPLTDYGSYAKFGRNYAPFVDIDGDGKYDPSKGDYPDILGDQYIWWVFNDMGNIKLESKTTAIGMEVQTSAFGFSTKDYLNDATFYFYKLINRGTIEMTETWMATWTDADLGNAYDDYIGCDTARSLGILYNGKTVDGNGEGTAYGSEVPMVGVDFFIGPKRRTYTTFGTHYDPRSGRRFNEDTLGMTVFNYFNNAQNTSNGNPNGGLEIYRIMTGYNRVGAHITNDQASCPGSTGYGNGPLSNFVYYGNPNRPNEWSECACNNQTGDRRFVHSSGPFQLEAGGITNDIIIGATWVPNVGGCPNTSFTRIRAADDMIQDLFDNKFKTIEGPEAPRLVVREMDRKLIFYLVNDSGSTNFQEQFGYNTSEQKYRVSTPKTRRYKDSLYKFEGYRVFQLKNASVTPSQIFGEDGEVNKALAAEVFQTDIKNGVGQLVNWTGDFDRGPLAYRGAEKVRGKDSGLVHSFVLTQDAFSKSEDKRFVNYRTYYFVAIAYAQNQFRKFDGSSFPDSSQLTPYLESSHAANGKNLEKVEAMPNPANGDMGTVLNSDYGTGVIIKRLEGIGNGGNETSFDSASEQQALLAPNYQVMQPTYQRGMGPVDIKVVDPRKVKDADWELYIMGAENGEPTLGIKDSTGSWMLKSSLGDVIYSEKNLRTQNEQILENYGISVEVHQVVRPGDTLNNNGYINSTISYENPDKSWLAGVPDAEGADPRNWIRSGKFSQPAGATCNYADTDPGPGGQDPSQVYEGMLFSFPYNKGTWAPSTLGVIENSGNCGFGVANSGMQRAGLHNLPGVDIVFTSDKTKWTKALVIEMEDEILIAEGGTAKFKPRSHRSWTGNVDNNGNPVYASNASDTGMSYFPGYAINQETGERMNIIFGEDSYLKGDNGADMIWNPTSRIFDPATGNVIFGGKHYVYILGTKYDEDKDFIAHLDPNSGLVPQWDQMQWTGLPTLQGAQQLLPLKDNLIPTETRIRLRVTKPYGKYIPDPSITLKNNGFPLYSFSTKGLAPAPLSDAANKWASDKQGLLDQIHVSPNPYYAYVGYERSRLDTKVRIVNLPKTATINIYSLDGTLIRTLTKDNPNVSYVDWDIRNAKGLAISGGMYLVHVRAEGIGETVIRWFGAMRPLDVTNY